MWDGGDAGCDHTAKQPKRGNPTYTNGQTSVGYASTLQAWGDRDVSTVYRDTCGKCGAVRVDRQIGLEASPSEYLATMVGVFREIRRVLRRDGTCWVNMGSSYSSGKGSNVTDQLNCLIEGGSVFFADTGSHGVAGHGVGVALKHERAPESELTSLLAAKRNSIEQRDQNLGKIADLFAHPGAAGPSPSPSAMFVHSADAEMMLDEGKHRPVISPRCDPQPEAILTVLRASRAGSGEDEETALAIHQPDEPSVRGNVRWHSAWHTFAGEAVRKGLEDVHLVDQAIALGDRPQTLAGLLRDFRVAKASEKQITLTSVQSGLSLTVSNVGQLWFILRCGSIVPYSRLYADASRSANALLPKQDIGMPWRLARALQEDGWILRSPIIWHKPNPMPESCRDRPTSAHEHVFLLTRSARYYYDNDAVRERQDEPWRSTGRIEDRGSKDVLAGINGGFGLDGQRPREYNPAGRNLRNVWTIATHAYPEAHFATFPPELAERCICAGTSERGCCAACGKPWQRITNKAFVPQPDVSLARGVRLETQHDAANQWPGTPRGTTTATTTGWSPGCQCDAEVVPCTVLDPFIGAGTTALVADRLQRDCIGIDLNTAYTRMAMDRCIADAPLFTSFAPAEDPEETRMADLFAGDEYERRPSAVSERKPFRTGATYVHQGPQPSNGVTDMAAD